MRLIDPPSGWKYGFPKAYDNPEGLPIEDWLVNNGYPKSALSSDGKPHWVRWIEAEDSLREEDPSIKVEGHGIAAEQMSEFTEGIEIMRQSAIDCTKYADDLEHAAHMIKNVKFFISKEEGEETDGDESK